MDSIIWLYKFKELTAASVLSGRLSSPSTPTLVLVNEKGNELRRQIL